MKKTDLVNQQMIRGMNLKRIYRWIDQSSNMSRAALAQKTGLSKTTVSSLVDDLVARKYIVDCGAAESLKTGRKPNILEVDSGYNRVAVISWRAGSLDLAVVDASNRVLFRSKVALENGEDGVTKICSSFDAVLLPQLQGSRILGVCIVIPGIINAENGTVLSTVVGIQEKDPVVARLREHFAAYTLSLLNDTACLAYAECNFSHIQEPAFAYVNLSRGVGACLFEDGKMLRGAAGMATQFGHCSIDRGGAACACGNRGCLEQRIGEKALPRRAMECGLTPAQEKEPEPMNFAVLGALARTGNAKAAALVKQLASDLAFGLSNLISIFHPSLIVLGGTGMDLGDDFLEEIHACLLRDGFQQFVTGVRLRYARLRQDTEVQGAAQYYIDFHYDFLEEDTHQLFLN